jgi:hypothetical protein
MAMKKPRTLQVFKCASYKKDFSSAAPIMAKSLFTIKTAVEQRVLKRVNLNLKLALRLPSPLF